MNFPHKPKNPFKNLPSGLVHPGDIILEANGRDVKDPEKLQKAIEDSGEFIVFKIQPSNADLNGGLVLGPQTSKASNESKVFFSPPMYSRAQGDQIGRIFAYWVLVYFWVVF
jgi:hypothetical protein